MKSNILLLLFILFTFPSRAIHFRHLTMKDGLSQLSVMSIYQDKMGRMWFGTEEGINVYDGNSMVSYKFYITGKLKMGIEALYLDGDDAGNVYCCTGSALLKFDLVSQKMKCLIPIGVSTMACYHNQIYFARGNAIYMMKANDLKPKEMCRFSKTQYGKYIKVDSKGNCWIGTNAGLYVKPRGQKVKCFISGDEINQIYEDSYHNIWISTHTDGCYLKKSGGGLEHFTFLPKNNWQSLYSITQTDISESDRISSNMVRGIAEDDNGNIWLGTFLGLNKYNPRTGKFSVFAQTNNPYSISHSSVFPVFKDKKGTIWVGTYYGGVNYFNPNEDIFTFYSADIEKDNCLSSPIVGHMVEDKRGDLWVCTEGGGLNKLNRKTGKITHYLANSSGNSIAHNNLKCIVYDKDNDRLYIGTHTGGISIFDIQTGKFNNVYFSHPDYFKRYGDQVFWMSLRAGQLIFTTQAGLWKMDVKTYKVLPLFKSGRYYGISYFYIDSRGYIWISAKYGLYKINLYNEKDQEFFMCGKKGLGDYYITDLDITEDPHGQIYVVAFGSGLYAYNRATDSFYGYTENNSNIISNYCYEVQSFKNKLLINTDKGFSIFDTDSKEFWNIEIASDFPLTGIHRGCGMYGCSDDEIFVGGTNGLASFSADRIQNYDLNYQLFISRLFVNNQEVLPDDSTGILDKAAYYTKRIDLNYDQSNITIYFTTNNYIGFYRHPLYEYKLEGYGNRWIPTYERRINYTKIAPGSYTLIIREKPQNGKNTYKETRLEIVVHPPFYKTTLAYIIYILVLLGILYYVYRFKRSQLLLTMSLEQEKKDKKNIIDLNQAKLQFFTNISHEFRTPLTLLIAKLNALIDETSPSSALYRKFKGLNDNASHMLELVNELLDFRKMEQGHINLHVTENDVVPFVSNIYQSFAEFANNRHIKYVFNAPQQSIKCWFDQKQMEKVIFNLLSNAFKYVENDKGSVELQVLSDDEHVIIKVLDNGIGISKKDIYRIFERFYQAGTDIKAIANAPGTGIGLALVKDILDAHHGTIRVESSPGYGSVFIVELLKGKSHYTSQEISDEPQQGNMSTTEPNDDNADNTSVENGEDAILETPDHSKYKILLVEDNEEMLMILKDLFSKTYQVFLARNGQEGLETVRTVAPDLVVSDVMMPIMSGTDMCKAIKDDLTICHIPVVLLTAMGSTEHEINGLKCGADDYIVKPFEPKLLVIRCNNLIRSRLLLKKSTIEKNSDIELLATNPMDKKFLQDCNAYIEENMDNSDFSVDALAQKMNMGRTTFFNKFKALTGVTPNDYVLNYRLNLSAVLLKEKPELQISDVAYRLGFNSPHYFSQCFKRKYGVTPKDFRG